MRVERTALRSRAMRSLIMARDWRSKVDYEELEAVPLRDLAWEYLRRNPNFVRDYRRAARTGSDRAEAVALIWGLRFRGRSDSLRRQSPSVLEARPRARHADARAVAGGASEHTPAGAAAA